MKEPVLCIHVVIDGTYTVKENDRTASMVTFHGYADCENFCGRILPGAVDTQYCDGQDFTLSARYILEGRDRDGKSCRIFIENNGSRGADGKLITKPVVITDSEALSWLSTADLYGTVNDEDGGVRIDIYKS